MDRAQIIASFHEGSCTNAYELFGAHFDKENGRHGVRFTVYAPHANNVFVVGNFTGWDEHPVMMEKTQFYGVWSVFVAGVRQWDTYKYMIDTRCAGRLYKADPYAFFSETRPSNASRIFGFDHVRWHDANWLAKRGKNENAPLNIYEVYAGGWKKNGDYPYTYKMMEDNLLPYVKERGFTHIEMMPLNEYPFDGSWGYQASGYYALTSRYGHPGEFISFIDACHREGIGVIMDMVPVHFVKDDFGLRYFDGEPLYEYENPDDATSQWDTMNFNLWSEEVRSFLISAACFWCDVYHVDGIRLDAVSNLIYWGGNRDRGTNEGSLYFIKRMNYLLHQRFPGVMLIAEDSSDYPKVTVPVEYDGLGFDYKWDLGWMNDTLKYYETDPLYRCYHHGKITFSIAYFFSEKFMLPLSHDENVHGKKTIIDRMWGDYDQKFAQVRNLYAYMFAHPGKKLNFMGNEIASFREFDEQKELDWFLLAYPRHDAFLRYFTDLNKIYKAHGCLWRYDYDYGRGFQWIDSDNAAQSVYSFFRQDEEEILVCVLNMTPASYEAYDIGVPQKGVYTEILNSEKDIYDGNNMCNFTPLTSFENTDPQARWENMITLTLAPFAAVWLTCPKKKKTTE